MLRIIVIVFGAAFVLAGIVAAILIPHIGWLPGLELGGFGALILASLLFENRYRSRKNASGTQWQSTGERFIDPTTGKLTDVRYNPTTGERAYVDASSTESAPK